MDGHIIILMIVALLAAALTAQRARARGYSVSSPAEQLGLGLLIAIPIAQFALFIDQLQAAPRLPGAELALHFGLLGALSAVLIAARMLRRPLLVWADLCAPAVLLGQAAVIWGAALGQGRPSALLVGAVWQLVALWALLWAESRLRRRLRPGDTLLLYNVLAAPVVLLGLATHHRGLCVGPGAGDCLGAAGAAQLIVVVIFVACAVALSRRHGWLAAARRAPSEAGAAARRARGEARSPR